MSSTVSSSVEVIRGEVRHTRFAPTHHSFKVPAFCLRLHMTDALQTIHSKWFGINKPAVFSVNLKDYGTQGHSGQLTDLIQQIKHLIAESGLAVPNGDVYLHTFPRILGYVFNPVSFWYLHQADASLSVVVCEVNNTFGERHFYVLTGSTPGHIAQGEELQAKKEFHVSPFFEVQGNYRFRFFTTPTRTVSRIDLDNHLGHALSTSISGERMVATDAIWKKLLWSYRWFTIGVIVKIHWQALQLFIKGVRFFSKPTPPSHISTASSHLSS